MNRRYLLFIHLLRIMAKVSSKKRANAVDPHRRLGILALIGVIVVGIAFAMIYVSSQQPSTDSKAAKPPAKLANCKGYQGLGNAADFSPTSCIQNYICKDTDGNWTCCNKSVRLEKCGVRTKAPICPGGKYVLLDRTPQKDLGKALHEDVPKKIKTCYEQQTKCPASMGFVNRCCDIAAPMEKCTNK